MVNMFKLIKENRLETFCEDNNINIHTKKKYSPKIKGYCYHDGFAYYVFLNPVHNVYQLRFTLIHELIHIFENHFIGAKCEEMETQVDCIIDGLKNELREYFIEF